MKKIVLLVTLLGISFSLISCSNKVILIYTPAEKERISYLQEKIYEKFPQYKVVFKSTSTGAMISKLDFEGKRNECDIFFDVEVSSTEMLRQKHNDMFHSLDEYNFDIYDNDKVNYIKEHKDFALNSRAYSALIINKRKLDELNIATPKTYADLLDIKYEGLIAMPNPQSSGTGYAFYAGVNELYGEEGCDQYFSKLDQNMKEYTTSGSAPTKMVQRGEVAIGVGILWQVVQAVNKDENLDYVLLEEGVPYTDFVMGIVNTHESKPGVKEVFDYLFNELNQESCLYFTCSHIYKSQQNPLLENYPLNIPEIEMKHLRDYKYKNEMLDRWKY